MSVRDAKNKQGVEVGTSRIRHQPIPDPKLPNQRIQVFNYIIKLFIGCLIILAIIGLFVYLWHHNRDLIVGISVLSLILSMLVFPIIFSE